jgi:hypothetical protein
MTRAFTFVVMGVIYIIAYTLHTVAAYLFHPDGQLYELAASATHFDAAARAAFWSQVLVIWVPVIMVGGITLWGVVREYRRQTATAVQPRRAR